MAAKPVLLWIALVVAAAATSLAIVAFWLAQPLWGGKGRAAAEEVSPERLRAHVEFLTAEGRDFAHPARLERAAAYVEAAFREAGGRVESQGFEVDGARYRNVIARFGAGQGVPLIVGAHYDALERTPGADDNASGVAALLEVAAALGRNPPRQPVELVAYTLEEAHFPGGDRMGSRHHADALAGTGIRPRGVVVLEMVGYFDDRPGSQSFPLPGLGLLYPREGNFIAVVGELLSPRLVRRVKGAMAAAGDPPVHSINAPVWVPGIDFSDHAAYWRHGMPAVMVTDTAFYRNPNYHQPGDRPETLDYRRMAGVARGVLAVIRDFDAAPN